MTLQNTDHLLLNRSNQTFKFKYSELKESLTDNLKYRLTVELGDGQPGAIKSSGLTDTSDTTEYTVANNVLLEGGDGTGAQVNFDNTGGTFVYTISNKGANYSVGDLLTIPNGNVTSGTFDYGDAVYLLNTEPVIVGDILTTSSTRALGGPGGTGATVEVVAATGGVVSGATILDSGYGYEVGDVITVSGYQLDINDDIIGTATTFTVSSVGAGGAVIEVKSVNVEDLAGGVAKINLVKEYEDMTEQVMNFIRLIPEGSINFEEVYDSTGSLVDDAITIRASGGSDSTPDPDRDPVIVVGPSNPTPTGVGQGTTDYKPGTLWYNTTDGRLYVYYFDGNSYYDAGRTIIKPYWTDASPSYINEDKFVKSTGDENITGSLTIADANGTGTISAEHFNIAALSPLP